MNKTILITGGAGFIGVNAAESFIADGWHVIIFDNLSRIGAAINLKYLTDKYSDKMEFVSGDVRTDLDSLQQVVAKSQVVLHLAGQVAVTTSVVKPKEDFEINAWGTLNVLEAARQVGNKPLVIFASTNKVYGGMEDVKIVQTGNRYIYQDLATGIPETRFLDFHSPYGCSKGCADQYVRDYYRIYGLPTVVIRQSCIYGPHQFGIEDQGWVAWFAIASILDKPITIYGDGKQVRDVLFVTDVINAYKQAIANQATAQGKIFNIGGGPNFTLSLLELVDYLQQKLNKKINYQFSDWRPGDQPVFVSDITKAKQELNWEPKVAPHAGIDQIIDWTLANREILNQLVGKN